MIRAVALLACLSGTAGAECRQALALGLDVSGSVDAREYRLQVDGLARALMTPEVRAALLDPGMAPVRIAVFEWSGATSQRVLVDWTAITDDLSLAGVASRIVETERRLTDTRTGLGPAMLYGNALLDRAGPCVRRTLDLSGDGRANHGPRPVDVRLAGDVTVNGLVIGADAPANGDRRQMQVSEIVAYYDTEVIRGSEAFVEVALGFESYEAAMVRKLVREIQSPVIGSTVPGPASAGSVRAAVWDLASPTRAPPGSSLDIAVSRLPFPNDQPAVIGRVRRATMFLTAPETGTISPRAADADQ